MKRLIFLCGLCVLSVTAWTQDYKSWYQNLDFKMLEGLCVDKAPKTNGTVGIEFSKGPGTSIIATINPVEETDCFFDSNVPGLGKALFFGTLKDVDIWVPDGDYNTKTVAILHKGMYVITVEDSGDNAIVKLFYQIVNPNVYLDYQQKWLREKEQTELQKKNQEAQIKVDGKKYIPIDFLEDFKGLYPKEVSMNKVVYPNGDTVDRRSGLLFISDDSNFMITLGVIPQLYAAYGFKSHPDLGNIISMQVFFDTDVAVIAAKNNKVVDYEVIGKLNPGTYAIPLDDRGHNKGFFRVNLPDKQLDYWYFQLEDCTLSPDIVKESSTLFDYK